MGSGINETNDNILGATDGTAIGNVGDRLKVDAGLAVAPQSNILPVRSYLLNGSTENMNVNGSSTPVNYTYTVPSGQTLYLETLYLLLIDGGTMDEGEFGTQTALTNGVLVKMHVNGTEYTICTIKKNEDLPIFFTTPNIMFTDGASFLSKNDIFSGRMDFLTPITLKESTGDYVRITIQDNLTGIDNFRCSIGGFRTI